MRVPRNLSQQSEAYRHRQIGHRRRRRVRAADARWLVAHDLELAGLAELQLHLPGNGLGQHIVFIGDAALGQLRFVDDALAGLVEITPRDVRRFRRLLEDSRRLEPLPIKSRLTDEEVAKIAANRYRLPGIEIRARLFRSYPHGELASHLIGHIGRISQADRKRLDEAGELSRYLGATHIGKAGIEQAYEPLLHGRPGYDEVEVSAAGRVMRTLSRHPPVNGADLTLTIDLRLQSLAEQLFNGRRGALVAIEPASGEVLALVSQPSFDPNLFVDGIDPASWQALNEDPNKPLLNRALRGTYPPGSTYKPFMALAALETGMRRPGDITADPGYFQLGEQIGRAHV